MNLVRRLNLVIGLTITEFALSACQSPVPPEPEARIEVQTRLEYPVIGEDLLTCPPEPMVPADVVTDTAALSWAEDVRRAGQECRRNLQAIHDFVSTWPKPEQRGGM